MYWHQFVYARQSSLMFAVNDYPPFDTRIITVNAYKYRATIGRCWTSIYQPYDMFRSIYRTRNLSQVKECKCVYLSWLWIYIWVSINNFMGNFVRPTIRDVFFLIKQVLFSNSVLTCYARSNYKYTSTNENRLLSLVEYFTDISYDVGEYKYQSGLRSIVNYHIGEIW